MSRYLIEIFFASPKSIARRQLLVIDTGSATNERLARLDRFHGTLRRMIGELFAVRGRHGWVDAFLELIHNYNTRLNLGLEAAERKLAPIDIGPSKEAMLRR